MATTVNIYEAKTQLSKLVDTAAQGEDVIIARNGKPIARITTLKPEKRPIRFGLLEGKGLDCRRFRRSIAGRNSSCV